MTATQDKLPIFRRIAGSRRVYGDIGVEIEVEYTRAPDEPLPYQPNLVWITKADGSLRNVGYEYVTEGAKKLDKNFKESLETLIAHINENRPVHNCPRTSVHVHLNMKERMMPQIWNTIVLYWLLEPLMMEFCGANRKGSLYCLQLQHAEALATEAQVSIERRDAFTRFNMDHHKYAGQNLAALAHYGTLEYRGMRGVLDAGILWSWISGLHAMAEYAASFKNPSELMDEYMKTQSIEEFLDKVFSKGSDLAVHLKAIPDLEGLLSTNISVLGEIAYGNDWIGYERYFNDWFEKPKVPDFPEQQAPDMELLRRMQRGLRVQELV